MRLRAERAQLFVRSIDGIPDEQLPTVPRIDFVD